MLPQEHLRVDLEKTFHPRQKLIFWGIILPQEHLHVDLEGRSILGKIRSVCVCFASRTRHIIIVITLEGHSILDKN